MRAAHRIQNRPKTRSETQPPTRAQASFRPSRKILNESVKKQEEQQATMTSNNIQMKDTNDGAAFKHAHGDEASKGTLTYQLNEQDEDMLQLVDDADLALAKKHGSEPLKITSTEVDTRDVFDHASSELAKHGLDAPATELKK